MWFTIPALPFMVRRPYALGDITLTHLTRAPPMATTERAGSSVESSSEPAPGMDGTEATIITTHTTADITAATTATDMATTTDTMAITMATDMATTTAMADTETAVVMDMAQPMATDRDMDSHRWLQDRRPTVAGEPLLKAHPDARRTWAAEQATAVDA